MTAPQSTHRSALGISSTTWLSTAGALGTVALVVLWVNLGGVAGRGLPVAHLWLAGALAAAAMSSSRVLGKLGSLKMVLLSGLLWALPALWGWIPIPTEGAHVMAPGLVHARPLMSHQALALVPALTLRELALLPMVVGMAALGASLATLRSTKERLPALAVLAILVVLCFGWAHALTDQRADCE